MAAFIQKLFQKRSRNTVKEDPKSRRASSVPSPDKPSDNASMKPGQQAIDEQRAVLTAGDTSQQILAELAITGLAADIRLQAAQRLTDQEQLQEVQRRSRGKDKGVYQRVRQTLQELRHQEEEIQATQQARAALLRQAEELAATQDMSLYEARLQKLEQQWQTLESGAENETRTRVLAAFHQCRDRARDLDQQRQLERTHQAQKVQREETLELLRETLESFQQEAPSTPALPALDALQRTQENRWLEATRDTEVSRQEQKLYEQRMQLLKGALSAVRRLAHHQQEIAQALEAEKPDADIVRQLLEQLEWPRELSRPEPIQKLARIAKDKAPATPTQSPDLAQQKMTQLEKILESLEQSLEARQLRESRTFLKQAQNLHRQLTGREGGRYRARMQRLAGQVRELGDWRGFATEPKQTALCEQMEYLADQPMDPEAKAARIHELQQQWKDLGGSSNRDLWQRFRAASDRAFEPCRAYFEARSDLKKVHLQKRQSLCEELQLYLDSTDWSQVDWKAAEQIEKTARKEWREAWPVEFRDNRPLQKTFDELMNTLSGHLDEERARNEARKQAIVERAQQLTEHSPLTEAMQEARELQKQWQGVGITRHREDRKLWKAFRAACDEIFARRDEKRQQQVQATSEADQSAEAELTQARRWLDEPATGPADADPVLGALNKALAEPVSDTVRQTLRDTLGQVQARQQQLRHLANLQQWQRWIDQRRNNELEPEQLPGNWPSLAAQADLDDPRELVVLAEILGGHSSPDADKALRMELQVQRLRQGLGGDHERQGLTSEALVARWCLALPPEELEAELGERLKNALEPA